MKAHHRCGTYRSLTSPFANGYLFELSFGPSIPDHTLMQTLRSMPGGYQSKFSSPLEIPFLPFHLDVPGLFESESDEAGFPRFSDVFTARWTVHVKWQPSRGIGWRHRRHQDRCWWKGSSVRNAGLTADGNHVCPLAIPHDTHYCIVYLLVTLRMAFRDIVSCTTLTLADENTYIYLSPKSHMTSG